MNEYDYLNARVRAMASKLLPDELIDQINRTEGEDIFVDLLMDSAYSAAFTEVLASSRESDALETALKRDLYASVEKVRGFAGPGPLKLIDIQLERWDLENIIAVLRGKRRGAEADEIQRALFPAGRFHPAQLSALAAEDDAASVADALSTWGHFSAPAVRSALRAASSDSAWSEMESELYRRYYDYSFSRLDPLDGNEAILRGHLALQADLVNILALLKRADRRSRGETPAAFAAIPGGTLRTFILSDLEKAPDVERSLESLELTSFSQAVERGILSFGRDKRLAVIERFLEAVVIKAGMKLFRGDPLSSGVPLGYLWKKVSEFMNLRILLRGKRFRMPANAVKEALILA